MSGLTPFVIVPVKPLAEGKSRLDGACSQVEREALNYAFLQHTLAVTGEIPGAAHTIVVSRDGDVLACAAARGAHAVAEPGEAGLNAALAAARTEAVMLGATAILVLPIDLPLLTADDVGALIADPGAGPCARVTPDEAGAGTNALYVAPPGAIGFHFGRNSFAAHLAAAREAGLATGIVHRANIAFDVDTPDDYDRLRRLERIQSRPIAAFVTNLLQG